MLIFSSDRASNILEATPGCVSIPAPTTETLEIEVSAELNVYVDMYTTNVKCVVTEVIVGDEKNNDECPLYIYVVKPGQTVWDIAKDMNVSQELIMEQNPDIALPLKSGDKLVIYKPNIMKF